MKIAHLKNGTGTLSFFVSEMQLIVTTKLAANSEPTIEYFKEWLEGLPENIRKDMEKKGFEECKSVLPFTRYVNERNDIGLDDFLKENLTIQDYEAHQKMGDSLNENG